MEREVRSSVRGLDLGHREKTHLRTLYIKEIRVSEQITSGAARRRSSSAWATHRRRHRQRASTQPRGDNLTLDPINARTKPPRLRTPQRPPTIRSPKFARAAPVSTAELRPASEKTMQFIRCVHTMQFSFLVRRCLSRTITVCEKVQVVRITLGRIQT